MNLELHQPRIDKPQGLQMNLVVNINIYILNYEI